MTEKIPVTQCDIDRLHNMTEIIPVTQCDIKRLHNMTLIYIFMHNIDNNILKNHFFTLNI